MHEQDEANPKPTDPSWAEYDAVPSSRDKRTAVADDAVVRDRARGALLGLAVGDALGTTLEFSQRDSRPHHVEITGGGPFRLRPGEWTDDTAMALALADSLVHCRSFDPDDLMRRFVGWWRDGDYSCTGSCFDIGTQTRDALARFEWTGNPYAGTTAESDAGNGSLMRLSPVAIYALDDAELADRIACDQSRTTHGAPQAVDACIVFTRILRHAILRHADPLAAALAATDMAALHPSIAAVATRSYRTKDRAAISSSGYVVHTLEAALWCVHNTTSFAEAVVRAVNLADDADTVGAVTGQLAGAIHGANAIPERWLQTLAWRERLDAAVDQLLHGGSTSSPATVDP
ncbi:ADP-ribosylglycohydrolase family protein [Aureimonas leprariae]|uniref:ADP-ribosylglycohydrolase family protein n=1 Tax=Plantimonas leprariae TaxID=2615207 RepID=A0A7V7PLM1_9HYPH|nr:ADP-ribosylglycohydrolase family protein [Aureimonas leprariae]KAB0677261.1 ADP-ribosylglycohydrolase family protein [Aureimonas leprariae]